MAQAATEVATSLTAVIAAEELPDASESRIELPGTSSSKHIDIDSNTMTTASDKESASASDPYDLVMFITSSPELDNVDVPPNPEIPLEKRRQMLGAKN